MTNPPEPPPGDAGDLPPREQSGAGGATPPPQGPPPGGPWGAPPPPGAPGQPPPAYWGPPSGLSPSEERTWAMAAHIGALVAGVVAMAFLGPLIIMLTQGTKSAFVRRHAVESLNFQITLLIALAAGIVLSIVTLGVGLLVVIPAAIVIGIASLV
ncbi:MAG: DUF4870 domain-containing protein, partial [Actinomycetes bacterium]